MSRLQFSELRNKAWCKKPNLFSLCPYSQDKNNHRYPWGKKKNFFLSSSKQNKKKSQYSLRLCDTHWYSRVKGGTGHDTMLSHCLPPSTSKRAKELSREANKMLKGGWGVCNGSGPQSTNILSNRNNNTQ